MKVSAVFIASALLLALLVCLSPATVQSPPVAASVLDGEDIVDQLMLSIRASRKPLPVWAIDTAIRAYTMWKTYKNGEKVEAVRLEVIAVLRTVAEIKEQVETGKEMTEREYRLTPGELGERYAPVIRLTR